MYQASIDIGSNSCLLLVGKKNPSGNLETIESEAIVTSLGKGLDLNKKFLEQSMHDTFDALKRYTDIISKYDIPFESVIVTATEASRVAQNADDFFLMIKSKLNLHTKKISGEGEAYYTAMGVISGLRDAPSEVVIMDIGGASTELIRVNTKESKIESSISLPIGSVRAADWINQGIFEKKKKEILVDNLKKYSSQKIICVAGTMTTLSAMILEQIEFKEEQIQGHNFTTSVLSDLSLALSKMSEADILKKYPLCGKRAFSIYGGSLVANEICNFLNIETIEVSTLGLRYGVIEKGGLDERFIE
jgi:exopolyphosphatase/guanosine-5'-triphosphate,3'-diphosphate pyrophosphatase